MLADPGVLSRRAGIALDPWQHTILESQSQALLINCSRQAGKSTGVALLIVQTLLQAERMVVLIAPALRQTKELMRKVLAFWRRLGRPVEHTHVTRTSLELENGSRLEALPGRADTIVGFSAVDLLVTDEAGLIDDDLYMSVAPMLAVSGGRLVAPSTPWGKRGWWYELWQQTDDPQVERIQVPATQVPRISREFLTRERRRIGDYWFNQSYMCVFQEAVTAAFRESDIDAMFSADVPRADWLFAE